MSQADVLVMLRKEWETGNKEYLTRKDIAKKLSKNCSNGMLSTPLRQLRHFNLVDSKKVMLDTIKKVGHLKYKSRREAFLYRHKVGVKA